MLVGATLKASEIPYWEPKLAANNWMRIFPDSNGVPPVWTDARFQYCQRQNTIPFISSNIYQPATGTYGGVTALAALKTRLETMPSWVTRLYLTNIHEPEGNTFPGTNTPITAAEFRTWHGQVLAMLNTLDAGLRAKIHFGPVLTRQYTENTAGRTYDTWDPGPSDTAAVNEFFGVDFYGNSWSSADSSKVTTTYVPPATILARFKAYKKTPTDVRPRIFPEIGYIGAPFDVNGDARAQWLAGIAAEVDTWTTESGVTGWPFHGFIWWNTQGTSGASLTGAGTTRWFQLDRRHNGTAYGSDPQGGYATIASSPVLARYNTLAVAGGPVDEPPDDPGPEDPGGPDGETTTSLVATPEPAHVPPRVLLELSYPGQTSATVTRLDPDGRTHLVRLADPAPLVDGVWIGYDYESWLTGTATYTATTGAGSITATTVALDITVPWLRHPGIPSLSLPVEIIPPLDERTHTVNQAVLQPLGRRYPVVVSDGRRKSASSSLTFRTFGDNDAQALLSILDDVSVLLLDAPANHGLGMVHEYLSFGDLRERRFDPDYGPNPWRNWTAAYTIVGRPAGGLQSQRTWTDVLDEAPTWAALGGMYDTWADVLTGSITVPGSGGGGGNTSYDTAVLADNPEGYWLLDGTADGLLDRSGNGHHAVNHGAGMGSFLIGGAAVFNGGQYIEVPNHPSLSVPATGVLTFEVWMSPSALTYANSQGTGDDYIHWAGKNSTGQAEYVARMYNEFPTAAPKRSKRISGYVFNPIATPANPRNEGSGSYFQDDVQVGEWIHYTLVINSVATSAQYPMGYTRLYRDGMLRDTDNLKEYNVVPQHGTTPLRFGTSSLESFFQGRITRAAVYNHELTRAQIVAHYRTIVPAPAGTGRLVRHVGDVTTRTTGTRLQIMVGASGVAAGSTLLATVGHSHTVAGPTMADSRGNTWTRVRSGADDAATIRGSEFQCHVHVGLRPGDRIEVRTAVAVTAMAVSVDEYADLAFVAPHATNSGSATSTTPGASLFLTTTEADTVVRAGLTVAGPSADAFTADALNDMQALTRAGTNTGDSADVTIASAWRNAVATGANRWQPALGVARPWVELAVAYTTGIPTVVPPAVGSASKVAELVVASSTTTAATMTVTVDGDQSVPVGHTLIATVNTDYTAAGPTMTDSRGNTWTRNRSAANPAETIRVAVFSCPVTTAIQPGDTLTVTWSGPVAAKGVTVLQYTGVLHPIVVDAVTGVASESGSPSSTITTVTDDCLLVAAVGMGGPANAPFTPDITWVPASTAGTTAGGGAARTVYTATRSVVGAGGYTYAPLLAGSYPFALALVAYRAG